MLSYQGQHFPVEMHTFFRYMLHHDEWIDTQVFRLLFLVFSVEATCGLIRSPSKENKGRGWH